MPEVVREAGERAPRLPQERVVDDELQVVEDELESEGSEMQADCQESQDGSREPADPFHGALE